MLINGYRMVDKTIAYQIFNQLQEEYDLLYAPILAPDIQDSCDAQWSKSSRMIKTAQTERELDEVLLRAKKLITWCEFRYWDAVKGRNQIESKTYQDE